MIISRPTKSKQIKLRLVDPFSPGAFQSNTQVKPCPKASENRRKSTKVNLFRFYLSCGELPVGQEFGKRSELGLKMRWYINPTELNYFHYLPIFFDGLVETDFPHCYFARTGIQDLLAFGGEKVLPVIPQLILPIKNALHTKNHDIVHATLISIQNLLKTGPYVGLALVPYYIQILPILNIIRCTLLEENLRDKIFFKANDLAQMIDRTVELMERLGGPDAFMNIKYVMRTYESCILN